MATSPTIDFDRLLKLRLAIGRFGEMDRGRWWNTQGLLSRKGGLLMSRGFPRTHRFTQARVVFAVARARSAEVFEPPACMTLWKLPAAVEDRFDARWSHWLEERELWSAYFDTLEDPGDDLLAFLRRSSLLEPTHEELVGKLRRSAEGRAVPLSGTPRLDDEILTLLAAGFCRGETGKPAIPYARLQE